MFSLTVGEVAAALGAPLRQGNPEQQVKAVSTDSRDLAPGALFFALPGERYDGHRFVNDALAGGAVGAVVSQSIPVEFPGAAIVTVPDVLAALGGLARYVRRKAEVFLIGVTGSTGKTTTKDIISSVLGVRYRVLATQGNLNNEIGVPLTLLGLEPHHRVAVIEMAMRGAGEIAALARIASPDAAVITNIGETHLERLGSVKAIAQAKGEILDYVPSEGFAVLHNESPFIREEAGRCRGRVIFFGTGEGAVLRLVDYTPVDGGSRFKVDPDDGGDYHVSAPGRHNALNAVAAIAVARELGMVPQEIRQGLRQVRLSGMRLEIKECGSLTVINDAYNANPASMLAAFTVLNEVAKNRRRVGILGNMLELGERAAEAHRDVGKAAAGCMDVLVAVGDLAQGIIEGAVTAGFPSGKAFACDDSLMVGPVLKKILRGNEVILVKASRGMHLEAVVDALCAGGEAL
ncbi:MAG: UDP-N-acetylmuramoyl-tripeptide--D-alanyl-D-alanine ligase [Ammonifex sp.]|nr:MAG: UDP-N-acetylmuramoyl-tripeptide--D-alanyl-D-alanine ligase [Ammonifex sp.]